MKKFKSPINTHAIPAALLPYCTTVPLKRNALIMSQLVILLRAFQEVGRSIRRQGFLLPALIEFKGFFMAAIVSAATAESDQDG